MVASSVPEELDGHYSARCSVDWGRQQLIGSCVSPCVEELGGRLGVALREMGRVLRSSFAMRLGSPVFMVR